MEEKLDCHETRSLVLSWIKMLILPQTLLGHMSTRMLKHYLGRHGLQ
jgi:hypothetical protein